MIPEWRPRNRHEPMRIHSSNCGEPPEDRDRRQHLGESKRFAAGILAAQVTPAFRPFSTAAHFQLDTQKDRCKPLNLMHVALNCIHLSATCIEVRIHRMRV